MNAILSVTRRINEHTATHFLIQDGDRLRLIGPSGTGPILPDMTAVEAVRHYASLNEAHADHETRFTRHQPNLISRDDLLDAIRPTGRPCQSAACSHLCQTMASSLDTMLLHEASGWSIGYRIAVDDQTAYTVPLSTGGLVVVHADNPRAPYDSWTELLASTAVTHHGGSFEPAEAETLGLYLIRPGLIATAFRGFCGRGTGIELSAERIPDVDAMTLMRSKIAEPYESSLSRALRLLVSPMHDEKARDALPRTVLTPQQVQELVLLSDDRAARFAESWEDEMASC